MSQWVKNSPVMGRLREHRFNPWVRKIPWKRAWQPILLFLSGESHGQSITGYSPEGHKESDMVEGTEHKS